MIRIKTSLDHKRIRRLIWLVLTVFVLFGYSMQSVAGNTYYSMAMQNYATVGTPPVILQNGTAGNSTIYTNNTSAKVNVEAPLFDYVDNNEADADSSVDRGMHSNFPAQQAGPDATYDMLTEENTEAIDDYVDNNLSDVDNSSDVGSHSNFENQKYYDSIYDTLTEENTEAGITKVGTDTSGTGNNLTLSFSHTLVSGTARIVVVSIGVENGDTIDVSTVTYGGVTMTLAVEGITGTSGFCYLCEIWYILDNDLPSDGSQTVEISCSGTPYELEVNGFCAEYTGVNQGVPEATDNTDEPSPADATIENTLSPSDDSWVVSIVGCGNSGSFTHAQGQVEVLDFADNSSTFAVAELRGASGETSLDSTYSGTANRLERVAASWTGTIEDDNYELDLEIQFTAVIDFLSTEALCINTGAFSGTEDINVDFWNGTGWENLATDLTAYSSNEYSVSLTSATFTVRFKDGTTAGDSTQDQWQIDVSLLRVEGTGSKEDAVDNDTSDMDSSADLGNLVNFDNMKTTDSIYANLTESSPVGITYINRAEASAITGTSAQVNKPTNTEENDFMIALLVSTVTGDPDGSTMFSAPSGWTNEYDYTQSAFSGQHVYIYWKVAGASEPSSYTWTWTSSCGWVAQITAFRGVDTGSPIHVEGTINQETSTSPMSPSVTTTEDNCMIWLYDMCDDDDIPAGGGAPSATTWIDQTEITSPGDGVGISTAYFIQASAGATGNRDWTLAAIEENSGQQYALKPAPANYQLDQEVQWTNIPYLLPNENLSIYGGSMGVEDLEVDVWNGTGWENVFNDLSAGWNNASITDWLTTSNFTIRFKGGNETGDTSPDTWQIDVALINVWHEGTENYELDLEVQWASVDYTRTNEELCIKTGTFSGSENIQVKVWNNTGSSWHWVMNLTASQWNNVSITSYLTSSTLTVQFLGGTETGDTIRDSWNIDATLLHIWTSTSSWLSGWDKRVKIMIDHNDVDDVLSDFPVLVHLSSSSGRSNDDVSFIFDEVGSNGNKIAVTTSDGTTQCYVEEEEWNATNENAWLWVKVPNISNTTDTELYLYYDNEHADNTGYVGDTGSIAAQTVWDSYFKGVWHLSETSGGVGAIKDSTSNNNVGTDNGGPTFDATGMIDSAISFDGFDDYINVSNSISLQFTSSLTIEGWINLQSFGSGSDVDIVLRKGEDNPNDYQLAIHDQKLALMIEENDDAGLESSANLTATTWYYLAGTWNGSIRSVYLNGSEGGSGSKTGSIIPDTRYIYIGGRSGTDLSTGVIDEVRTSNTTRSAAWIKASYETGRDDLLDFSSEETNIIEDYVDDNTSNVDNNPGKGTHGNFTAQQYGPDSIYDTLTEDNTGVVSNMTFFEDWESGSIASENWTTYSSAAQGRILVDTDTPYEGNYALWMDVDTGGTYSLNELITNFDFSGATQVVLDFYHNEQGDENEAGSDHTDHQNADGVYYTLDGSYWYHLVNLVDPSGWTNVNINVTADPDFQGPVNSSFAIKFTQYDNWPRTNDGRGFENINITYQTTWENYELDLEVQWTDASYLLPNEELCIKTGATGTENVKVDVWNGTEWINILTNLTPNSWNNVSVSSYLTLSNFTIRFKGVNETGDTNQDSWNIDATVLHVWTSEVTYDYVLRVNNTGTDSWEIRLKKYSDSNVNRLQNCTIYFHNSSDGTSNQLIIENGAYINQTGPWYDLGDSQIIYIAMTVQANDATTSNIYAYLEIRTPNTTTYAQYVITFEIT